MKIGQRVSYRRRGQMRHGTIVGIEVGSIAGTYYIVRADASELRHAVLPAEIIAH